MNKSRFTLFLLALTVCSFFLHSYGQRSKVKKIQAAQERKELTMNSTEENAIESLNLASVLGESILKEKYGEDAIDNQKPLNISLIDNKWIINGQKNDTGSCYHVEISKATGAILAISDN